MGKSDSGILDASLTTTLVRVARMAAAAAEKALAAENLTLDHWMTLEALASTEGLTMAELRDRTGTPAPTLTRVADKLVSLALIYREVGEDDRRKVRVFLSLRGKSLHKRVAADIRVAEESWLTSKEEVKLREGLRPCAPFR
ncbi:DNA-binding MarR family transcriptional regulator [Rhodococcus erythropolis]|uniref:MarR family transcriptional regulator n=1 Tax=Rhodococcus TaxID=1827 RepID=UPI001561CF81|nr:MarR family transcriptional regulator [Rhodococcus erythropolis]MCS4256042.1 DNA-binding MarR family transcriptional regulator [Rhodococcus erythropolis]NRH31610.1 MarR family transcriptional regulator [Rhodococcus sp. MS13]